MVSFNVRGFDSDNEKASALAIAMTKVIKDKTAAAVKAKRAFVPSAICPIIGYDTVLQEVKQRFFRRHDGCPAFCKRNRYRLPPLHFLLL
ncbi:hypothetical protein [Bacillus atrophaeus]|uniref:hypothetical protein n=1 Tax=Bacillus atrophaeus TaxID=1452 RepID=UPI00227E4B26|nr:hypothetical protein [Bacillus atrophaeus]MCY8857160.1 hypothetical protein [Bacillus atrophaeus]